MLAILQNRSLSVAVRAVTVQNMAEEMQKILEESDLFELADVFEKYEEEAGLSNAVEKMKQELNAFYNNAEECFLYSQKVFGRLDELEHLSDDWEDYLKCCQKTLYGSGVQGYRDIQKRFKEYCTQETFDGVSMEIILEQLLVYFIFTYFCGAVYDDNVIGKTRMSVDSVTVIYEMFAAKWAEKKGHLSAKDIQQIVYRYSRELEHSDVNLGILQS